MRVYFHLWGRLNEKGGAPCPCSVFFPPHRAPRRRFARSPAVCFPCVPAADALLLLCDLPDAFSEVMPEDAPLLRALQSAVMAADARCPGHFLLLVRKRVWDDAARLYLGENQPLLPMQTVAALLAHGHAPSAFAAASFSPASLAGQFSAALFCPADVSCTPDVPRRMLGRAGRIRPSGRARPVPAGRRRAAFKPSAGLFLFGNRAPRRMISSPAAVAPAFPTACFSPRLGLFPPLKNRMGRTSARCGTFPPSWPTLPPLCDGALRQTRRDLDRLCRLTAPTRLQKLMLSAPPLRLLLLFFAAVSGWEWVAVLALLEPYALLHPRMLPAALVRLRLSADDGASARPTHFSRIVWRIPRFCASAFPRGAQTPAACAVCGAALLPAAFLSLRALAPLLFVSLLWLAAPPLFRALTLPETERIPLSDAERARLLRLAREAFAAPVDHAAPGAAMLAACGGCMLGLLEPDEAARQMTALLPDLSSAPLDAHETACALAAAQAIRERMADCDAALRSLPAQIERACAPEAAAPWLADILDGAQAHSALFLPLRRIRVRLRRHPSARVLWPCRIKQKRPTMRGRF